MLKDLVLSNRSYRRFYQGHAISIDMLRELVDLARLSASASNLQSLKYILSCDPERNTQIFDHLAWARFLDGWDRPEEGERPSAYIVILNDTTIARTVDCDHGIAAQTIMLGAAERGLGGCMIGSIKRNELRQTLGIDQKYDILLVLAIGKPKETVRIEPVGPDGNTRYWRDAESVHHVPKRALDEIIVG